MLLHSEQHIDTVQYNTKSRSVLALCWTTAMATKKLETTPLQIQKEPLLNPFQEKKGIAWLLFVCL